MIINFKRTKYIVLVLENCDEIMIDIKDIKVLDLKKIYQNYSYWDDGIQKIYTQDKVAKYFHLILKPSANKVHHQFYGMMPKDPKETWTIFDRIHNDHDICGIKFEDKFHNELDYVMVVWKEASMALGAQNLWEKTRIRKDWDFKNGKVCEILITKPKKYLNKKEAN